MNNVYEHCDIKIVHFKPNFRIIPGGINKQLMTSVAYIVLTIYIEEEEKE
jgi:hypothetical protein